MVDENNKVALAPVIDPTMARLNITCGGEQGELPDFVAYDSTDADLKQMAAEAVQGGGVPGIEAKENVDFTDYIVDRFPAKADLPYNRLMMRPKTAFGR